MSNIPGIVVLNTYYPYRKAQFKFMKLCLSINIQYNDVVHVTSVGKSQILNCEYYTDRLTASIHPHTHTKVELVNKGGLHFKCIVTHNSSYTPHQ